MAKYGNLDKIIAKLEEAIEEHKADISEENAITAWIFKRFIAELEKVPTADVVPVVRCKDCKYNGTIFCPTFNDNPNGKDWQALENDEYCSYGERKELDNGTKNL